MKTFKKSKGQSMVEFALCLPILILIFDGLAAVVFFVSDLYMADMSANNAIRAAQVHVLDGNSCLNEALNALGNPPFIASVDQSFSITNCSGDPSVIAATNSAIVATWNLTIDIPLPLFLGNEFDITRTYTAFYSR